MKSKKKEGIEFCNFQYYEAWLESKGGTLRCALINNFHSPGRSNLCVGENCILRKIYKLLKETQ